MTAVRRSQPTVGHVLIDNYSKEICKAYFSEADFVILYRRYDEIFQYDDFKDVVTPYTHISEASRYILYTIILTFDGICTLS